MQLNIEDVNMMVYILVFLCLSFWFFNDIYLLDRIEDARKSVSWLHGDKDDNRHVIDREIIILKDTLVQRKARWVFNSLPIRYEIISVLISVYHETNK